jgi:hypothetical protein
MIPGAGRVNLRAGETGGESYCGVFRKKGVKTVEVSKKGISLKTISQCYRLPFFLIAGRRGFIIATLTEMGNSDFDRYRRSFWGRNG